MTTSNIQKEYLEKIVTELVELGEDKKDLSLWIEIYDVMSPEEQGKLLQNLEKELEDLGKLK